MNCFCERGHVVVFDAYAHGTLEEASSALMYDNQVQFFDEDATNVEGVRLIEHMQHVCKVMRWLQNGHDLLCDQDSLLR